MSRNRWFSVLSLLLFFTAPSIFPGPLNTDFLLESERAWLLDNLDDIELWYSPEYPPLEYADSQGNFIGIGADVISLVEEKLGVNFKKRLCNDWNEQLLSLRDGSCAIAPTIAVTPAREKYVYFTEPYASFDTVIITNHDEKNHLGQKDMKDYRVAVVSGFITEDYIYEHERFFNEVIAVKNVEEGLKAVAFGQADAFIDNIAVASYYINNLGITNLKVAGELNLFFYLSVGTSKFYPELNTILQKTMGTISEAEINEIKSRYITLKAHSGLSPENKKQLLLGAVVFGLLFVSILLIALVLKKKLNRNIRILNDEQLKGLKNAERYRALFINAPIALLEMRRNGEIVQLNDSFTAKFGYVIADMPHIDYWWDLAYSDDDVRKKEKEAWEAGQSGGTVWVNSVEHGAFMLRCKDGIERMFIISINVALDNYIFSFIDIDEQQKTASELKRSRDNFYTLFELAPFSCVINDFNGVILDTNQHFCRRNGKTKAQIIGKTNAELGRVIDPEFSRRIVGELESSGFCPVHEISLHYRGVKMWTLFSSQVVDWDDEKAIMSVSIDITEKKRAEIELQNHKENLEKIVSERTMELEEAIQELKEKEVKLVQAEKMASVGFLTAGVSHEINNPLNYLMGAYVNLNQHFRTAGSKDESISFLLESMKTGIDRVAAIVRGLNQLSRDNQDYDEDCDINEILDNCLHMLRNQDQNRINIKKNYKISPAVVKGNAGKLHQVFLNILSNAYHAIEKKGVIAVDVEASDSKIRIKITDDGCGIASDDLPRIIEPFYTTKNPGEGTGLGLSICYNIIQEHNGVLDFESEPGRGTTVSVIL